MMSVNSKTQKQKKVNITISVSMYKDGKHDMYNIMLPRSSIVMNFL